MARGVRPSFELQLRPFCHLTGVWNSVWTSAYAESRSPSRVGDGIGVRAMAPEVLTCRCTLRKVRRPVRLAYCSAVSYHARTSSVDQQTRPHLGRVVGWHVDAELYKARMDCGIL